MTIVPPSIPDSLHKLMAEIGPKWAQDTRGHIQQMNDRFSELLARAPKEGVGIERDIAYGPHERQRFDVYMPPPGTATGQALLFVHGGAFNEGHRERTPEIYANVLYYFARHGVVGVNIGYRLSDAVAYPGASTDIGQVVAWMREQGHRFEVDPAKIFLMGHSAGGAHVGSYAYDKRVQPAQGHGLAGLLVVSGRMRADNLPENPNAKRVESYYGADAARYDDLSPVSHVNAESLPTFIACAEYENPLIDLYCFELAYRLTAAKRHAPPFLWLKGHNHTSAIAHVNTAEDTLGRAMLAFMNETAR